MKTGKKRLTVFLAGVLSLAMVVSSWAFFTSTYDIENKMSTKDGYGSKTVEEFTPEQKVEPGSTVTKKVGVTNTGDSDLVVRIKMDEAWARSSTDFISFASSDTKFASVTHVGADYTATQGSATDGLVTGDESVVYKKLNVTTSLTAAGWYYGGDGYWYYTKKLAPSTSTGDLLESITLATNTDMGKYTTTKYYSTVAVATITPLKTTYETAMNTYNTAKAAYEATPNSTTLAAMNTAKTAMDTAEAALETAYGWSITDPGASNTTFIKNATEKDSTNGGYAKADYTLKITTEVCQATKDAVDATFTTMPTAVKTAWALS